MKKLWQQYQAFIDARCLQPHRYPERNVAYWQNHLFSRTMAFVLPLSLITTIPSIAYSLNEGLYLLSTLNVLSFLLVLYIVFGPSLSLRKRKVSLLVITYLSAMYLMYYTGFRGPGFLYLYSACIFGLLILPRKFAYWWSWISLIICGLYALVIHYNLSPLEEVNTMRLETWLAISVNLIFLCFLSSALLPRLFEGLRHTFEKQKALEKELRDQQEILRKTLKTLKHKNSDLEQFAYLASHDLQEPLRMITSFLTQLNRKYGHQLDDKAGQYIHFAVDGATRMRQIILDLLDYSRVGQEDEEPEKIDLNKLVSEVCQLHQKQISDTGAKLHYQKLPAIYGYRAPLVQIFQNLISNALKYRHPKRKPEIRIEVEDQQNYWQIAVHDNGIGMEEKYFNKIFVLFQRLHAKGEYSGTGMGLAIVKKIVEYLDGQIWVESTPGEGSTFYLTIKKRPGEKTSPHN